MVFGGETPTITAATEEWNGLGWSTGGNLAIARSELEGAGTQTAGLAFGGAAPSTVTSTEEYNISNPVNQGIYCFTKTL